MKIPKHLYKYVIALFLLNLFLRIVLVNYYNNNLGGIEPNIVYGIQRILLGQPLYQDPASGTYAIMQYTPLYYYFTAGIARLTGVQALDVQGIYALCRVVALLFNLLTVFMCMLIIRTWRFSWGYSLIFALPALIILTSHYYTRGDSMHLFLFTAAVWLYILYSRSGRLWEIIMAALFAAACVMVKQSGVLIIGITGFCLLFVERKFLIAVLYTTCTFVFAYAIARLCIGNTNWYCFYQNAYLGLKNGIDAGFLYMMFISQFFMDLVPCYVLGGIMVYLAIKKIPDKTFRILTIGAVLSWLFAVTTGLKIGSSNNYFIEFLIFMITALPYLLQHEAGMQIVARPFHRELTIHRFAYIAFIILITSKTIGLFTGVYIEKRYKNNRDEYANEQSLYRYFKDTLNIQSGEHIFFTERRFLDNIFIEYAIIPNKDVVTQVYAASPKTFNYSNFTDGMNSGMVKYIVTDEKKNDINEWHKDMPFILFDKNKFRLLKTDVYGYSIYVYAPSAIATSKRRLHLPRDLSTNQLN